MTQGWFTFFKIALVILAMVLLDLTPSINDNLGVLMVGFAIYIVYFFQLNRTRDGRLKATVPQVRRDVVQTDLLLVGGWFVLYFFFKYYNEILPILRDLDQYIGLEKEFKTIREIFG